MVSEVKASNGALIALQVVNRTVADIELSQLRVASGGAFGAASEDPKSFAIAQRVRSDLKGIGAVKIALANGEAAVNVAANAGAAVTDLLGDMKETANRATAIGLGAGARAALQADFAALRDQMAEIVANASFNGKNLIAAGATALNVLSSIDGRTIAVPAQPLDAASLGLADVSLATGDAAAAALTALDDAISLASDRVEALGSSATQIDQQAAFTSALVDVLRRGVGDLVDTDLAAESANLQALQIKQQLGGQGLAIANGSPGSILALFRA